MANVKISALPIASTPLTGAELVPIVQSGVTSQTTVDNMLNPLAETNGSALIGYLPAGTNAELTTVQAKLREIVSVEDFGAVGDGVTNDSTAIQSTVDSFPQDTQVSGHANTAGLARGAFIFPSGGQYNSNTEVSLYRKNLSINGQEAAVKWTGTDATASIFKIQDSSRVKFFDLILLGDYTNPPYAAFRFYRVGTADNIGTNENCIVDNVIIGRKFLTDTTTGGSADTTPYGKVQNGIMIDGVDGNNDEFAISNVQVHNATVAGINFNNTQSIWSSLTNTLVNDSAIGYRVGCNLLMTNVNANRNSTVDIYGIRNLECWVNTFNSENSTIYIQSDSGASFFVSGGELQRNSATPQKIFKWNNGGSMVIQNMTIENIGGSGDTIYYRSGSTKGGLIKFANCTIQDGSLRTTWDIDTGGASALPSEIDIDHGTFKWKTTQPYMDRAVTPAATAAAASQLIASGASTTSLGNYWNVSYGLSLQGQHLTNCPESTAQIRARVFNVTGGSITLVADRMRWMNLGDYVIANSSASIDVPLMTNNTGSTQTITLPGVSLGDYVVWGTGSSYINSVVTSYVSAANTVSLRVHNASGGNSDPPATTFYVAKLKEFGNFQNTLAYTPAAIANAATVTLSCTVTGAQLGGHTFVAYTNDLQGLICTAYVSAADTVTIVLTNYTGGAITLGAGYFKVMVAF